MPLVKRIRRKKNISNINWTENSIAIRFIYLRTRVFVKLHAFIDVETYVIIHSIFQQYTQAH